MKLAFKPQHADGREDMTEEVVDFTQFVTGPGRFCGTVRRPPRKAF
jgi:hypothetical protein